MAPKKNQKAEVHSDESSGDEAKHVLDNMSQAQIMQALASMGGMAGMHKSPLEDMPKVVKRRVGALMKLHDDFLQLEVELEKEIRALNIKYEGLFAPIFAKRADVITGKHEPTDAEVKEIEEDKATVEEVKEDDKKDEDIKGIQGFWVTALTNSQAISERITEADHPILEHLVDIRAKTLSAENPSFTLEFHFSPNEYLVEPVLTKTFTIEYTAENGHELKGSSGTTPTFNKGKSPMVKMETRKQKHKTKGTRTITKEVPVDSFFDFFKNPGAEVDPEDQEAIEKMEGDYDIADIIQNKIVPHAVQFFLGEGEDDGDYYDDEDGDFEDDGEDDDEDEDDDEEDHPPKSKGKGKGKGGNAGGAPAPECKQS